MHLKIKYLRLSQAVGLMGPFWKDKLDFYNIESQKIKVRLALLAKPIVRLLDLGAIN